MLALLLLAVVVGGVLQRVSGMGFGLVAGPFIVLVAGPVEGILLVNVVGAVSCLLILGRVVAAVDWRRYAWLAAACVAGSVPAALLLRGLSAATLEVTVGLVVVLAMTLALVTSRLSGTRRRFPEDARWPLVLTGLASAFASVAAGVGGPPLAVYSVLDRWDPRRFAATAQAFFLTNAGAAAVAKVVFAGAAFPTLGAGEWVAVALAVGGGIGLGEVLAPRLSRGATRRVLIVLACAGGVGTLARGLAGLS